MKNAVFILMFEFLFIFFLTFSVCAEENQAMEQAKDYDLNDLESIIDKNAFEYGIDFDFDKILNDKLNPNLKTDFGLKSILKNILVLFFGELYKQTALMKNIFIICVLSGIFKSFTDSFKTKGVSELGFYACYISSVMLLINSFGIGLGILKEIVLFITELSKASIPILAAIMISCGEASAGGLFAPLILMAASIVSDFISFLFIPGIKISAVISIINYLSSKEMLEKLSKFLSSGLSFMLKAGAFLFMGIISLNKIGTSSIDNALSKTMQAGINSVPIIGDVFSNAAQSIVNWSRVLKTGLGISCFLIRFLPRHT